MEAIIIGILIGLLSLIITREFWCWYFKINKRNDLLEKILYELIAMNGNKSPTKNYGLGSGVDDEVPEDAISTPN